MNTFKKRQSTLQRFILRFLCLIVYASMLALASSVQADLQYLEEATESTRNQLVNELVDGQSDHIRVDDTVENNKTHLHHLLAYLNPLSKRVKDRQCDGASEAHFDHCFDFVSADRARLLKYLQHLSAFPLAL